MSILFYGITIWAPKINRKKNVNKITSNLRPLKLSLCSAYTAVSNFAIDTISGIPPTDILIEEKLRKARKEENEEILNNTRDKWREV